MVFFPQLLCGHSLLFRQRRQASVMLLLGRIRVQRDLKSQIYILQILGLMDGILKEWMD